MGIRLYPRTNDVAKLEKLAGVPAGTHTRLKELQAAHKAPEGASYHEADAAYGRLFDAMSAEPNVDRLDSFILSGWGKRYSPEHQDENGYGHVDDVGVIARIFDMHGITADPALTEGVYWS